MERETDKLKNKLFSEENKAKDLKEREKELTARVEEL